MAYSRERKSKLMISKLKKQLKPGAGRRVSAAEQRRIKAQIARLEQTKDKPKYGRPPAPKGSPFTAGAGWKKKHDLQAEEASRKQHEKKHTAEKKRADTPSATDKANAAKAAKRSSSRRKTTPLPQGKYSKQIKKVFG